MRTTVGQLRSLVREAVSKQAAEEVASVIANAAAKAGARVSPSVDASGGLINVFVRLVSGDPDSAEPAMTNAAELQGWSLLSRSDRRGIVWWFEPGPETKGPVPRSKLPNELWHVTPGNNVDSVMTGGFEPRARQAPGGTTRRYTGRVYLATSLDGAKATINRDGDWRMLRVDVSKLPKSMKFYVDQEFGHRKDGTPVAVYTTSPVPPAAISVA